MAVAVGHLSDGELVEVLRLVVGDLLSVDAERLGEVAVAVEKPMAVMSTQLSDASLM